MIDGGTGSPARPAPAATPRPARVLVGTVEIAGMIPDFADGLRRLGCPVTTVGRGWNWTREDIAYDINLESSPIRWPASIASSRSPLVRPHRAAANRAASLIRLARLIRDHDVFFFMWAGTGLTEGGRDYPLLKRLGKRIITLCCGSDVRHMRAYCQQYDDRSYSPEMVSDRLSSSGGAHHQLRNLRLVERYSDLVVSLPNQAALAVRPYAHLFIPIDLGGYRCAIPGRDVPVVVHAPSHRAVKGTEPILASLRRLRDEGVAFDLRLIEGLPNHHVIRELEGADVAVDQLYLPLHGKFGVEVMATGCALATCNREDYEPFPPGRPIWHIDRASLDDQLRRLLTDRDLRVRLAHEGRRHVERHHDHVHVARRYLEQIEAGGARRDDHHPRFFAERYRPPDDEPLPEDLKTMTTRVVRRWGLPEGVDPRDMIARGLMSADGLGRAAEIPRWPA